MLVAAVPVEVARFSDLRHRTNENLVIRINPMRIDDVLVLLPELRPESRIFHDFGRDPRQRVPCFNGINFELFGFAGS